VGLGYTCIKPALFALVVATPVVPIGRKL